VTVDRLGVNHGDVRIELCRVNDGVAEDRLYCPEIRAVLDHVRCAAVAKLVRAAGESAGAPLDDHADGSAIERPRLDGEKQRTLQSAGAKELCAAAFEVLMDGFACLAAERHDAVLVALPSHDRLAGLELEIRQQPRPRRC